ncbi:hypothetical protein [Fictibacillus barbaricus]|uniref:Leucine-rich repeat domain-containing protein n=1 Tax=Fictibacillus barbaricus TaxID=182136 RepID=A0ABS2ZEV0_9BACL|nr:hypothetical protein [Fictibacillus barbaricus]MBN3545126.1 hypothetical protein [Fictibacillus barbaricus]GGB61502.1 hypothetical protein GCM10007199_29230 [Fictibacillus barbaricus]
MENWRNNTIWFEQIPDDLQADLNLKKVKLNQSNLQGIEYLTLRHYKSKMFNLDDLHIPLSITYLDLTWSNIHNFIGIGKYPKLKRLELHYSTKLQDDLGLSELANTIEHLHINQSKKFRPNKELFSLKNLRVLCLNSCGNLENLDFLHEFPNLIDFRFVDTNVLEGDLSPILEHPTIRSVGFLDKKHYSIKFDQLKASLNEKKGGEPFKTVIKYGDLETYRYIY